MKNFFRTILSGIGIVLGLEAGKGIEEFVKNPEKRKNLKRKIRNMLNEE
jgi:hypothetical protein